MSEQTPLQQNNELHIKVLKHVTLPLLKLKDGEPAYVRFVGAIFKAKKIEGRTPKEGSKASMEAPDLVHIFDHKTRKPAQMIVNNVLGTELSEMYAEKSYIGKSFAIVREAITGGRRYATFQIQEIEDPNPGIGELAPPVAAPESQPVSHAAKQASKK